MVGMLTLARCEERGSEIEDLGNRRPFFGQLENELHALVSTGESMGVSPGRSIGVDARR
jgi:hypothetical protein